MVRDTDGSAFITKAEFDSLKNSFQSQLDSYNQNIDGKIDSAIASYLSGVSVNITSILTNQYKSLGNEIMFGVVPFNETVNNKVYSLNCAVCLFSDGYVSGTNRQSISSWLGNKDNISSEGDRNAFNWAMLKDGKYFYMQNSKKTYIATYYNLTGGCYVNTNSITPSFNMADGSGARNLSKKWNASDDWTWNKKMEFSDYIYSRSNTWPVESDYIRGNVVHIWQLGTLMDTSIYAQSFSLSNNDKYNELVIETEKEEDYCGTKATINPNLKFNIATYEATDTAKCNIRFDGNIAYYSVKTTTVDLTNLYQKTVKDRIGIEVKLYEGLPLFETLNDGEATFDCTLHNTDAGNVNLYFRDTVFANTDTNTGKTGLNGSYYVDNGDPDPKKWDKYDFTNGTITLTTASAGTKIRVLFKASKGNYYFKLVPSGTEKFAWMSDCSDITFELSTI